MASTSRLTVYTRATPVPYGPIALAGYIAEVSGTEGVIDVQYAEKASDAAVTVTLESGRCVQIKAERSVLAGRLVCPECSTCSFAACLIWRARSSVCHG